MTRALICLAFATTLAGCASTGVLTAADPKAGCASLAGSTVAADLIGLPSGAARVTSATWVSASKLSVAERGPTPAATITPALPDHCRLLGSIAPLDPAAPPINFQLNLPENWNGRSVQYGGGGFNGTLITGLSLLPAARFDEAAPLARGYATYGTDSGHQTQPGQPPQAFALNDEALVNFAHASYKKVRDVAVALMQSAYGRGPSRLYFIGSSEGGREGLTMAQRYPDAFDGIFSRVPVIHWTGLQHAGLRDGLATMGEGWIRPPQVKLVHEAVLAACDGLDGVADGHEHAERHVPLARPGAVGAGAAFAAALRLRPRPRPARVPGPRPERRRPALVWPHRRLDDLVAGQHAALAATAAQQQHRLVLRRGRHPILLCT
jgi:feruloyl esterase